MGQEGGSGRLWLWGHLVRGRVAELLERTPGFGNRMIRNVQLFVGHFDLLPGQVTHVLPATHASRN